MAAVISYLRFRRLSKETICVVTQKHVNTLSAHKLTITSQPFCSYCVRYHSGYFDTFRLSIFFTQAYILYTIKQYNEEVNLCLHTRIYRFVFVSMNNIIHHVFFYKIRNVQLLGTIYNLQQ